MKKSFILITVLFFAFFISSCDIKQYRPNARGAFGEVIVVMDSTAFQSPTAEAIRSTFAHNMHTIPDAPQFMDLRFKYFSTQGQLENLKKWKNIIIAAPINGKGNTSKIIRGALAKNAEQAVKDGDRFYFIRKDVWYNNQWVLFLTAPNNKLLSKKIKQHGEQLTDALLHKEFERWRVQVYDDGERFKIEEHLWNEYGWKVRVKHDWSPHLDTTYTQNGFTQHFYTLQRISQENDRRMWAWWVNRPINVDTLSVEWIHNKRDEIWKQWFRGSREGDYVQTSSYRPVETDTLRIDGFPAYETQGVWRMVGDVMAGPFVSMTIYDSVNKRLFVIGFWQFGPSIDQRPYIRQWRAMLRTFESDSTFSAQQSAEK